MFSQTRFLSCQYPARVSKTENGGTINLSTSFMPSSFSSDSGISKAKSFSSNPHSTSTPTSKLLARASQSHSPLFLFNRMFNSRSFSRSSSTSIVGTFSNPSSVATLILWCPPITISFLSGCLFTMMGSTKPKRLTESVRDLCWSKVICLGLYSAAISSATLRWTTSIP